MGHFGRGGAKSGHRDDTWRPKSAIFWAKWVRTLIDISRGPILPQYRARIFWRAIQEEGAAPG